jgi:spore coat protein I
LGDKLSEVLECYDIEIVGSAKGRYAQIIETNQGVMQLRPLSCNEGRLKSEKSFKEKMIAAAFTDIDNPVFNRDGELCTADRYGSMYVMRSYFHGRELSVTNMAELDMAVENLAKLHIAGRRVWLDMVSSTAERLPVVRNNYDLARRNRELKRVRAYIHKISSKNRFEEIYLNVYDRFYIQAQHCERKMKELYMSGENGDAAAASDEEKKFSEHMGYCHGDYNNHNVLMTGRDKKTATVGFDKFYVGNQLADLYYLARKAVEKNGYGFEVLKRILDGYDKYIRLNSDDLTYIYLLFSYPEKFYKLSSRYLNGSKTRISPVMLDKLDKIVNSEQKKDKLLLKYREILLHI